MGEGNDTSNRGGWYTMTARVEQRTKYYRRIRDCTLPNTLIALIQFFRYRSNCVFIVYDENLSDTYVRIVGKC